MSKRCGLHGVAYVLVIIGALNWGLVGAGYFAGADWNVVGMLLGSWPVVENAVYLLVGVAALAGLFGGGCKACRMGGSSSM